MTVNLESGGSQESVRRVRRSTGEKILTSNVMR